MINETECDRKLFKDFAKEIGYEMDDATLENFQIKFQKAFTFLPELAVFAGAYSVKKTFQRRTVPPKNIRNNIRIFFHNIISCEALTQGHKDIQIPYVKILPCTMSHNSTFVEGTHANVVLVIIDIDYLKSFLKSDIEHFPFLTRKDQHFLIEEIMSDDILRTVNEIISNRQTEGLEDFFYKLKTMELLYYLFESLTHRDKNASNLKLSEKDILSIYKVRDRIASNLSQPQPINELKKLAGMNELKMRNIFKQIFGLGIYEYYQHLRMTEAARLLREEKLSVSETGYALGFENLSHFTRVFEQHIGLKPKKYSSQFR